ncbi:MAG: hypothetical protein HUJ63_13155 [Enterococcus sp.]|nr:hypothetical protein [Enterococcus sp.]
MPRGTTSGLSTEDLDDKYVTHRFIDSRLNLSGDEPVKAWSKKAVELWKKITGNDLIETNGKYANRRDIECRTHWWSCSNALPRFKVDDIDDRRAIEDRLWLIPTGKTVPHDERFDLLPILEENKNAIITKAMHCLHLLYHNKIDKPPCPDEVFVFSLRSYLPYQEAGPVEFIENCFDKTDEPADLITMKDVAKRYNEFFGLDKLTAKAPNVVSKAIAKAIGAKYTVHKSDGGYLRGFRWKVDAAVSEGAVEGETPRNKLALPASTMAEVIAISNGVSKEGGERMETEKNLNEGANADPVLTPDEAHNLMRRVKVRTRKDEEPFNVPKRVKVMTHKADAPESLKRVRVRTRSKSLNIADKLLNP